MYVWGTVYRQCGIEGQEVEGADVYVDDTYIATTNEEGHYFGWFDGEPGYYLVRAAIPTDGSAIVWEYLEACGSRVDIIIDYTWMYKVCGTVSVNNFPVEGAWIIVNTGLPYGPYGEDTFTDENGYYEVYLVINGHTDGLASIVQCLYEELYDEEPYEVGGYCDRVEEVVVNFYLTRPLDIYPLCMIATERKPVDGSPFSNGSEVQLP